ncbi:hypothetical protein DSO57_1014160 [Entomophthora muscae]|uniref:Uncharacterized protein n=1 Tax=Entomophthora muscae TaxID=34485 RepID=A0ACC2TSP5_9FUNG|nr:hypothetical protein DSO57_1014160 [Entomophthora muscae]
MASVSGWIRKFKASKDLRRTLKQLFLMDDIKGGVYVGQDQLGNKYYEDKDEMFARNRHVEYASFEPNSTQVPPQWRQWLHQTYQAPPADKADQIKLYKWSNVHHTVNPTGSNRAYKPYSTTIPKTHSWVPTVKARV